MTAPTAFDTYLARQRLHPYLSATPLRESAWLTALAGRPVLLKLESLNFTHSFKIRGAFNALLRLRETVSGTPHFPVVVTASAGNHGHAMAYAARQLGLELVVFTPSTAPHTKTAAIRRYGAALHDSADDYDSAERDARAFAAEHGAVFISPYNHPDVIAGAGTIGLEIVEARPDLAGVVLPLGGGGLGGGVGLALRAAAPGARLIGVEAEASTAFTASLAAGRITTIAPGTTLADGLSGNLEAGAITFALVQHVVDGVVTVSEAALVAAIRAMAAEEHLIVEGSSAVAVAAVAGGDIATAMRDIPREAPLVVVVTGANIDLDTFLAAMGGPGPLEPTVT